MSIEIESEDRTVLVESTEPFWPCQSVACEETWKKPPHPADYYIVSNICGKSLEVCEHRYQVFLQEDGWHCLSCGVEHAAEFFTVIPLNFQ